MRLFPFTKNQEQEFNDLRDEGFSGSLNDMIYQKLLSLGFSGCIADMLPLFDGEDVVIPNRPPVAPDSVLNLLEDGFADINLLALASDPDNDSLTITSATVNEGTLVDQGGGIYRYTPVLNFNGPALINYTVSDGEFTDSGQVSITVTAVNDNPVGSNETFNTPFETSAIIIPTLSDIDGDTVTISAVTQPANGSVVFTNTTMTYTPNTGFDGADSFTYDYTDGTATLTASVSGTVDAEIIVVTPPEITAASATGPQTAGDIPISLTVDSTGTVDYVLTNSSTEPTPEQVGAGNDHTGASALQSGNLSVTGTQTFNIDLITGLDDTTYYLYFNIRSSEGDRSTDVDVIGPITLDTVASVLSSPTNSAITDTSATLTITSNDTGGTLYAGYWPSATVPSISDIVSGTGAAFHTSVVEATSNVINATGLTADTSYIGYAIVDDLQSNRSNSVATTSFTTATAVTAALFDDFNRADSNLEDDSRWLTTEFGGAGNLAVVSNELVMSNDTVIVPASGTFGNDQRITATITAQDGGVSNNARELYLGVRHTPSTGPGDEGNGYYLKYDPANSTIEVRSQFFFGTLTTQTFAEVLASNLVDLSAPTFTLSLEAIGTTIRAYVNDTEITNLRVEGNTARTSGVFSLAGYASNGTITIDDVTGTVL